MSITQQKNREGQLGQLTRHPSTIPTIPCLQKFTLKSETKQNIHPEPHIPHATSPLSSTKLGLAPCRMTNCTWFHPQTGAPWKWGPRIVSRFHECLEGQHGSLFVVHGNKKLQGLLPLIAKPSLQCLAIQFTCKNGRYIIVGIQIWCFSRCNTCKPRVKRCLLNYIPIRSQCSCRKDAASHHHISRSQSLGDSGALQHPHVCRAMLHQFITFPPLSLLRTLPNSWHYPR